MSSVSFADSCNAVLSNIKRGEGTIGTLGERTLHAVLKHYYSNGDPMVQERHVKNYVADICTPEGIIEIQTRGLYRLKNKLSSFLEDHPVTVVYPVANEKWLIWIDESGEFTKKRKSPKKCGVYEVLWELYGIREFLLNENFSLKVVLLRLEEYKLKNGWSEDKKRGSTRYDRIPTELVSEVDICCPDDYAKLIPPGLKGEFTIKDFSQVSGFSVRKAWAAVRVLSSVGIIQQTGKSKNANLYQVTGKGRC